MTTQRGRPPHVPTEKDRKMVEAMASYGVPQDEIALVLGVSTVTLRRRYGDVLRVAAIKANAKMAESLFAPGPGQGARRARRQVFLAEMPRRLDGGEGAAGGGLRRLRVEEGARPRGSRNGRPGHRLGRRPGSGRPGQLMTEWSTAVPDWEDRLLSGRSLIPALPLNRAEADRALRVFKRLKAPDIVGKPAMAEIAGQWFLDIVEVIFGAYFPTAGVRRISEVFVLVPKKNGKSSYSGSLALTTLIVNRRPAAEFLFVAPTKTIANIAFRQAELTIKADPALAALFHVQTHIRRITHRNSGRDRRDQGGRHRRDHRVARTPIR